MRALHPNVQPVIAIGGAVLLAGCGSPSAQRVHATVDAWHLAAATGDGEAYFDSMTDDAVFIGTDASERWTVDEFREYAAPYFGRPAEAGQPGPYRPAWVYTPRERTVAFDDAGRVAWFDELLDSQSYGTARGTGVLVRTGRGVWQLKHYALTFPIPNELARDFTDQIKAFAASGHAD